MRTNTKEKNVYKCDICGKISKTKQYLDIHKNAVHFKIKQFSCPHCYKRFDTKGNLNQHISAIHDKVKFNCDVCDKTFTAKRNLIVHKRNIHEKSYRFNCKYCGKGQQNKYSFDSHMIVHHPMELEIERAEYLDANPSVCSRCAKRFPNDVHLQRHIKNVHRQESGIL